METVPAEDYPALVAATVQNVLRHQQFLDHLNDIERKVPERDAFWPEVTACALASALSALEALPPQVSNPAEAFRAAVAVFTRAASPDAPPEVQEGLPDAMLGRLGLYHMAIRSDEPTVNVARLFRDATGASDPFATPAFGGLVVPFVKVLKDAFSQVRVT